MPEIAPRIRRTRSHGNKSWRPNVGKSKSAPVERTSPMVTDQKGHRPQKPALSGWRGRLIFFWRTE